MHIFSRIRFIHVVNTNMKKVYILNMIMDFESGVMDEEEIIKMFQKLIDTGDAWTLQGSYGRMAKALIEEGLCTLPKEV